MTVKELKEELEYHRGFRNGIEYGIHYTERIIGAMDKSRRESDE